MLQKFVVTGPGCSGLSTTMSLIEQMAGIPTIPEAARQIIEQGMFHPLADPVAFRREQLRVQEEAEQQFDSYDGVIALDRGVYCGIGFCYATGSVVPNFLREVGGQRYPLVFLLEQIPGEERRRLGIEYNDGVRYEDPNSEEVRRLPFSLHRAYEEKGVQVVNVPYVPDPVARVQFILATSERRLGGMPPLRRSGSRGRVLCECPRSLVLQAT